MADIESRLKDRASALAPTAAQQQAAARSHNYLRDVLLSGNMECRINASYLSGSYARQTAIRPLDDVDVVFEIDPERWRRSSLARFLDLLPRPAAVLETFARAIRLRYPDSTVRTQRRSVGLVMNHLHIDVVPAVIDEEHKDWLRIPDLEADRWICTAPKVHSAMATAINSKRGERFKPLVRLLKGWNAGLPTTTRIKSFAIETLAARLFSNVDIPSLAGGMHRYFDFIAAVGANSATMEWNSSYGVRFGGWRIALGPRGHREQPLRRVHGGPPDQVRRRESHHARSGNRRAERENDRHGLGASRYPPARRTGASVSSTGQHRLRALYKDLQAELEARLGTARSNLDHPGAKGDASEGE